jgi:thiol-disulfide isomerase/thioredoxin
MSIFKFIIILFSGLSVMMLSSSCSKHETPLTEGIWQGYFERPDGIEIPFRLLIEYPHQQRDTPAVSLYSEDEIIPVAAVELVADSIFITLSFFDTELRMRRYTKDSLRGYWVDNSRDSMALPFRATPAVPKELTGRINGKFSVVFRPGAPNSYEALALFEEDEQGLKATFRTPSGDFRFLRGYLHENRIVLHRFDGQVIYLITADIKGDSLVNGLHFSGPAYSAAWKGHKDPSAEMSDPYQRTKVVNSNPILLKVLNLEGDTVLLDKNIFQDKITLLTIMGTWCPNCLDESRFIDQYLKDHPDLPIQVFGLCFERPNTWEHAQRLLKKYTEALNLSFPLYYAGKPDAEHVNLGFPMLDGIKAWPTMIILDKNGQISKVHTGFDGPAAGAAYRNHIKAFDQLMKGLSSQ